MPEPPYKGTLPLTDEAQGVALAVIIDGLAAELLPPGLTVKLSNDNPSASSNSQDQDSLLCVPLLVNAATLGWLVVRAERPEQLRDPDTLVAISQLASVTAVSRHLDQNRQQAQQTVGQLYEALASRATIDMAKGVVIAVSQCSPDEAFEMLRQLSQQQNRKLHQVAVDVIAAARSDVAVPVLNRGRSATRSARR
ncbi:MAG: ANTAR domain-containing protein [Actinomycetota bacterium]